MRFVLLQVRVALRSMGVMPLVVVVALALATTIQQPAFFDRSSLDMLAPALVASLVAMGVLSFPSRQIEYVSQNLMMAASVSIVVTGYALCAVLICWTVRLGSGLPVRWDLLWTLPNALLVLVPVQLAFVATRPFSSSAWFRWGAGLAALALELAINPVRPDFADSGSRMIAFALAFLGSVALVAGMRRS